MSYAFLIKFIYIIYNQSFHSLLPSENASVGAEDTCFAVCTYLHLFLCK